MYLFSSSCEMMRTNAPQLTLVENILHAMVIQFCKSTTQMSLCVRGGLVPGLPADTPSTDAQALCKVPSNTDAAKRGCAGRLHGIDVHAPVYSRLSPAHSQYLIRSDVMLTS
jgi:hypothetical protein